MDRAGHGIKQCRPAESRVGVLERWRLWTRVRRRSTGLLDVDFQRANRSHPRQRGASRGRVAAWKRAAALTLAEHRSDVQTHDHERREADEQRRGQRDSQARIEELRGGVRERQATLRATGSTRYCTAVIIQVGPRFSMTKVLTELSVMTPLGPSIARTLTRAKTFA
jgi:hypothetical protein